MGFAPEWEEPEPCSRTLLPVSVLNSLGCLPSRPANGFDAVSYL
ncbi:hypothetical protein HMPREF1555_01706 [Porphyromonas gingivalis F0570]|uniref:Uncharacterized protein n=1 Tax=Porphyromonas gingivalis F0570 TaxID=1227271 RepID=A0A0E2LPK2_PORGN|nr:hypothetical protein HMPREF1555_01706 [Porphyromonas gingivalis F0570]ERJ65353.1 hypothetical protein HMPREF1553_02144 [Porphyromonas gingivalis F0568]